MRKGLVSIALTLTALAGSVAAQDILTTPLENTVEVLSAPAGELRVLDRLTGAVTDLTLQQGETGSFGFLTVTLNDCRYPADNPSGDAYVAVRVIEARENIELFSGWMLASSPALNAMDHPRYDVWALRCITS